MLDLALALLLAGRHRVDAPPPMVRMQTLPPQIQTVAIPPVINGPILPYGSWYVQSHGSWADSWTRNDGGSFLGLACGKYCLLYYTGTTTCDKDDAYPALVSLPAGIDTITLKCYLVGSRYVMGMNMNTEWYARLVKEGTMGLAMGMKDGSFKVSRFELSGVNNVMNKLLELEKARGDDGQKAADFTI